MKDCGNRVITALVYLNEPEEGGETDLVNLGLKIQPATGKLLVFHDCCKKVIHVLCCRSLVLSLHCVSRQTTVQRLNTPIHTTPVAPRQKERSGRSIYGSMRGQRRLGTLRRNRSYMQKAKEVHLYGI